MEGVALIVSLITCIGWRSASADLTVTPRDTESKVNDSTYFNCTTDNLSKEIHWNHGVNYVYAGGLFYEPYLGRFQIEINNSTGQYNLVIPSVQPQDAGEYSCQDDGGHGRQSPAAKLIVLVNSVIVQGPSDTSALVNGTTHFNCSTSIRPVNELSIIWFHYPLNGGGDRKYVFDDGRIMYGYRSRFAIDIDLSSGAFNLLALRLEPNDAGRYECRDDIRGGVGASAELTVLEPALCQSDMDPGGVVGPTQCDTPITPDELQLSCSVTYNGNNVPQMIWRNVEDSSTINKTDCSTKDNRVTCLTKLTTDVQLNRSMYYCESTAQKHGCYLEIGNALYAFSNTAKRKYHTGKEVTCVANTSGQLPCSYKWFRNNTTEVSSYSTLELKDPGLYRCQADCTIRNDSCKFTAMVINVSSAPGPDPDSISLSLVAALSVIVIIIIVLVVAFCFRFKKNFAGKQSSEYETRTTPVDPAADYETMPYGISNNYYETIDDAPQSVVAMEVNAVTLHGLELEAPSVYDRISDLNI